MAKFFYTASPQSATVFVNGRQHIIGSDHSGFRALSEHLKLDDHDAEFIEDCVDKAKFISRMTSGNVTVQGSTVYYKGAPVHSTLSTKLVQMLDMGFDATPWAMFMDNVMQNPSENSKSQLYDFLSSFNAPFTEDGCFLVFKRVRQDYKDLYSGKFDNSIGAVVEMDRNQVVDDPNRTCSAGLHVCAIHYLSSSYVSSGRTIACKVNPRDVVSVPVDYKFAKIRCCRYEVVGDVDEQGSGTYKKETVSDAAYVDTTSENPNASINVTNGSGAMYEVEGFDIDEDAGVIEGEFAYHPESGRVGKVVNEYPVRFNDHEHPLNKEWLNGEMAGHEIDDAILFEVDFGDTTETIVLFEGDDDLCLAVPVEITEEEAENVVGEAESGNTYKKTTPMGIVYYGDEDADEVEQNALNCRLLGSTRADMWPEYTPFGQRTPANAYLNEDQDGTVTALVQLKSRIGASIAMTEKQFKAEVCELGQRGFDAKYNVPRTTVQDALRRLGDD